MLFNERHIPLVRSGTKTTIRRPHLDLYLYVVESRLRYPVKEVEAFLEEEYY